MQIELDRRIEESGDRTRIELFQSALDFLDTSIEIIESQCHLVHIKSQCSASPDIIAFSITLLITQFSFTSASSWW